MVRRRSPSSTHGPSEVWQRPALVKKIKHEQRSVGARIRALRKALGLTLEVVAERAAIHWTYLGEVERGEVNPSLAILTAIADALEVKPAALFQS